MINPAADVQAVALYWDDGGWMFPDEVGHPMDPGRDYTTWRKLCVTAGIPVRGCTTCGTPQLLCCSFEANLDLKAAGQVLGHVTVGQTAAYKHVLADRKTAAARAVDAFVFGATGSET